MSPAVTLRSVAPVELVRLINSRPLPDFLALCGDTLFLLVLLQGKDTPLEAALGATASGVDGLPVKPVVGSMGFRTVSLSDFPPSRAQAGASRRASEDQIVALLQKGHCFCVALRKRPETDAAFPNRISVGRAPNKDIVLRDPSVSKFHAWSRRMKKAPSMSLTLAAGTRRN